MIDEEAACLSHPDNVAIAKAATLPAPAPEDKSGEETLPTHPFPTKKAEKAAVMAAFMKAADELAKSELLKALRGSKWRFKLFEVLRAEVKSIPSLILQLKDACNGKHKAVAELVQSSDLSEFRAVPSQGLESAEDARCRVIVRFCSLWQRRVEAVRQETVVIALQRCVRCWAARKQLATRKRDRSTLYDAFGRCGLESVAPRLCCELGIQRIADASAVTAEQLAMLAWMTPQLRQRWRHFQQVYGVPVMAGVFSRVQSSQGFCRTTSMKEYNSTQSTHAEQSLTPQRAHSLESGKAAAGGGAPKTAKPPHNPAGSLICEHHRRRSVCKDCFAVAASRAGIPGPTISRMPSSGAGLKVISRASSAIINPAGDPIIDKMLKTEETSKMRNSVPHF